MSYIPPFKRSSADKSRPLPKPESLGLELKKKIWPGMPSGSGRILYADSSVHRWFPIGLTRDGQFPPYVKLEPNTHIPIKNSFALVNDRQIEDQIECYARLSHMDLSEERPWDVVVENILNDLLPAFKNVKNSIKTDNLDKMKPKFSARLGKVHFREVGQNTCRKALIEESDLRKLKRVFHTDLPRLYIDNIAEIFSSKSEFISQDKNSFLIQLSDAENPDDAISCKCREIAGSGRLQLGKIYLNDIRQLVVDVSCLNEKLDLRLLLRTRRFPELTDEEEEGIKGIISSAVIDSSVKGGLRWPLGKASFQNRFRVYCIWSVHAKFFESSSFRLKLRSVERFHFTTSTGESTEEMSVKLKDLVSKVLIQKSETDEILKSLKANIEFMRKNFFCSELFST